MTVRFVPNPAIGAEIAHTAEMEAALFAAAEAAAQGAQSAAPVRTGAYRDSIHAEPGVGMAKVVADDFKAGWIEFGTGEPGPTPAFAPLRRGTEMAGLRFSAAG